ncbi:MAG TPA: hypothetical protein PKJ70_06015 [Chitinophagaceae bacterium]|nr:hypothetical protein [Chitinophagaceae bacterium]HNN31425.1 hypothetical protein [Chitinophagaceae bacterium]
MSIFSATDLKAIIQLYQGGYISSLATFTIGVVTASNTVYLIKIASKT